MTKPEVFPLPTARAYINGRTGQPVTSLLHIFLFAIYCRQTYNSYEACSSLFKTTFVDNAQSACVMYQSLWYKRLR